VTYHDPIASLAPFRIVVTLADAEYEIPALPAADWLRVLLQEGYSLLEIVPGLFENESDRHLVEDQVAFEEITSDELNEAAHDVITIVSGRDWWVTVRFLAITRAAWDTVGAMMARANIDARQVSLAYWFDAAYHIARELIASGKDGQQNLVRFTSELEAPPPGVVDAAFDEEMEAAAFERAVRMAQP
jgi:hypothetical protein